MIYDLIFFFLGVGFTVTLGWLLYQVLHAKGDHRSG